MIDCSHANSSKDPDLQPLVLKDITRQVIEGNKSIIGVMLESFINAGNQVIPENLDDLEYGVSVTDACMDWDSTERSIMEMATKVESVLNNR
jgi:3-deoxy-7-phosphoheptulonate synthase